MLSDLLAFLSPLNVVRKLRYQIHRVCLCIPPVEALIWFEQGAMGLFNLGLKVFKLLLSNIDEVSHVESPVI